MFPHSNIGALFLELSAVGITLSSSTTGAVTAGWSSVSDDSAGVRGVYEVLAAGCLTAAAAAGSQARTVVAAAALCQVTEWDSSIVK